MATTARVGPSSMLNYFKEGSAPKPENFAAQLMVELEGSKAKLSAQVNSTLSSLSGDEQHDFFERIVIADSSLRIKELDSAFAPLMRSVAQKFRVDVRERLEGWWLSQAIEVIQGDREPITGAEVWAKFASINSEYYDERLPITFEDQYPPEGIDPLKDSRQFVQQLRAIGMPTESLQLAILDFYRSYSQRAHWARVNVLLGGEMQKFERRLVEEWMRAKAWVKVSEMGNEEQQLQEAGRRLYDWAENQSKGLQIRKQVTEDFIRRGSLHILADEKPEPRIHWHPKFLENLKASLKESA